MTLKCDVKSNEVWIQYEEEHENDNTLVRGNVSTKCRDRHCEGKVSEIINKINSINHLEEYAQDEHEDKLACIDLKSHSIF